jgi:hypothetical protein
MTVSSAFEATWPGGDADMVDLLLFVVRINSSSLDKQQAPVDLASCSAIFDTSL